MKPTLTRYEQARSIFFALLTIVSVVALILNVANDPTGSNLMCYSASASVDALITIGLWILVLTASVGALSATYFQVKPPERYKSWLVWVAYTATVPALVLLPSSPSVTQSTGLCASNNFFTYLSWYMIGVVTLAALSSIHILVHGVRFQSKRATQAAQAVAAAAKHHDGSKKTSDREFAETIKQLRKPLAQLRVQIDSLSSASNKSQSQTATTLTDIKAAATAMAQTIETHLDLVKIDTGEMGLKLSDLNLRDIVEGVCDSLRSAIMKRSLILLMRTNLSSQTIVHADKHRLQQILVTLITHSRDTAKKGTITVFVRDDLKNKKVFVDVINAGEGMTNSELLSVFKKPTSDKTVSHTCSDNLKLCLAHKLATTMKGTISAHSDGKGKGSRFTLVLPLEM